MGVAVGRFRLAISGQGASGAKLRDFEWRSGIEIAVVDGGSLAPRLVDWKLWSGKNHDDSASAAAGRRRWHLVLTIVWALGTLGGILALFWPSAPSPPPRPVPTIFDLLIGQACVPRSADEQPQIALGEEVLHPLLTARQPNSLNGLVESAARRNNKPVIEVNRAYQLVRQRALLKWLEHAAIIDALPVPSPPPSPPSSGGAGAN